jgi:hypothetical protein
MSSIISLAFVSGPTLSIYVEIVWILSYFLHLSLMSNFAVQLYKCCIYSGHESGAPTSLPQNLFILYETCAQASFFSSNEKPYYSFRIDGEIVGVGRERR